MKKKNNSKKNTNNKKKNVKELSEFDKKIDKISKKASSIDKKIAEFTNKIINKIDFKTVLSFAILFILLYFQNSLVSMYFDDFGNASLSYSYWTPDVVGTNYNFSQLIEWAVNIYNGWGGRILYAIFAIIPLLKTGIYPYMLVQTFVITGICFFFYKIIQEYTGKKYSSIPLLFFVLYSLIDMFYLKHGIYWASASVLYIWPLLPLFAFIYFYMKVCNLQKEGKLSKKQLFFYIPLLVILAFCTCFSQEQIGVALIAYIVFYILFDHLKSWKKYLKIDLPSLIASVVSYLALFLAPGNWARMDTNVEFAELSLFGKITHNLPGIIRSIFYEPMQIFIYILTIFMFYMIIKLAIESYRNKKKRESILLISIIPIFTLLYFITRLLSNDILRGILGILWLIIMCIVSILYFYKEKKLTICAIEIASVASIFCLVVSPVVGGRTCLPFIIFLIFIILYLTVRVFDSKWMVVKIITVLCIGVLAYKGGRNYLIIYNGYQANKEINDLNFEILINYEYSEEDKVIELYKVRNSHFGSTKSYEEPSMDFWIKEYFDIPHDVVFEWLDIYDY